MPILKVFSVRDSAAQVYGRPFFVPTTGVAIRAFTDHINSNDDSQMVKHPEDFELFELGEFDDESGVFGCLPVPKAIVSGKAVKTKE